MSGTSSSFIGSCNTDWSLELVTICLYCIHSLLHTYTTHIAFPTWVNVDPMYAAMLACHHWAKTEMSTGPILVQQWQLLLGPALDQHWHTKTGLFLGLCWPNVWPYTGLMQWLPKYNQHRPKVGMPILRLPFFANIDPS